jgi:hypothetical protein
MHLVGGITAAATSLVVDVTTGLPTVPFTLLLDPGLSVEEVVTVTAVGGTTLTVTRGVGGTSAQAHTNGAEVRHAYYGQDFQDSRDHEANTTTAHGVTGAVVGTTNTQTLTGKTMSGASNTFTNIPKSAIAAEAWGAYTPAWTAATTNPALGNGTISGRFIQMGQNVDYWLTLIPGSTTTFGSGVYSFSLPVSAFADPTVLGAARGFNSGVAIFAGQAIRNSSTTVRVELPTSAADNKMVNLTDASPWALKSADIITISGTYEAA